MSTVSRTTAPAEVARGWLSDELAAPEARLLHEQEYLIVETTSAIERAMESLELSKAELADRMNLSRSAVTQMLAGTRNLTLRTLATIALVLGKRITMELQPIESGWSGSTILPEPLLRESFFELDLDGALPPSALTGALGMPVNTEMALAA